MEGMDNTNFLEDYVRQRKDESNFQRYLIDPEGEIASLQNALRGVIFDQVKQQMVEHKDMRLINDKGARILTEAFLFPQIKNIILSNFQDEEIKRIMRKTLRALLRHLYENLEDYDIAYDNLNLIFLEIENFFLSILNRARYGAEQDRLITTQKVISEERIQERKGDDQQQPNRNIRDYVQNWGR